MTRACQNLFDELRAYKRSRALAVALSAGILDAVHEGDETTGGIAKRCSMREDWASSLLRVLADLGVVERTANTWKLTRTGEEAVADKALRAFSGYHLHCYEAWLGLPDRCNGQADIQGFHRRAAHDRDFVQSYLRSMDAIARRSLPFLKQYCRLDGRVLDVGAGPSTFCRQLAEDRGSQVTALDLPPIVEEARKLYGCPHGFEWFGGDFREYTPPQPYDAVFCSHLIEYAPRSELPSWLARMIGFLRPGGTAAFLTFLRNDEATDTSQLDLFELSTGVNGENLGHICAPGELEEALRAAGANDIVCTALPEGPSYSEYLVTCMTCIREDGPTDPTLDLLRTRVEHWARFSNSIDPYGKEPLQTLYDAVNSFLQRHAKISYNDFRGQCKPWEWTEDSYGLFGRGSIRRSLFDHRARLLLAALSDCEEMGIALSDLLRVLTECPIPTISQTPSEPTVQAIAAVLRDSSSAKK